jgi:hypothetical protein
VAILASLVRQSLSLGAWASHIFVDKAEAATYGKRYWGLPAKVTEILQEPSMDALEIEFARDDRILWKGWKLDNVVVEEKPLSKWQWLIVSLPSLSGCLPSNDDNKNKNSSKMSPLLRYPLRLAHPRNLGLSWEPTRTTFDNTTRLSPEMVQVRELLLASRTLVSIVVKDVELQAGIPTILS